MLLLGLLIAVYMNSSLGYMIYLPFDLISLANLDASPFT